MTRAILGEDYQGGLNTDCYSGYDRHATKIKQKCLSHLETLGRGLGRSCCLRRPLQGFAGFL